MLSQAFIASVLFGENAVPEETLLKSFLNYIAKDEEAVVAEALKGNLDVNELIDVLDRFGCRKVPTQTLAGFGDWSTLKRHILGAFLPHPFSMSWNRNQNSYRF